MNSVTVEELVMRLEIELDKFRSQAGQAEAIDKKLRQSLKDTEKSARQTGEGFDDLSEHVANSNKQLESKLKTVSVATRALVGFFAAITSSNALQRLANGIAEANDQLQFLSRRLGMAANEIKKIDNAVAALGGSNAQAVNTIKNLNQGIQEMVIMGNDSLIPFFGALGVGVTDAAGNVREMDDILLDMADSLSRMDPQRAYAIASAMGLDDGVANALIQGRDAMQEMLDMQKTLYVSTQAELEASRELRRSQTFLSRQWESFKTIIANAIIPHLTKMTKLVSEWMDYLLRNERTVRNVFEGIAVALGVVLIPLLLKAATAMLAFLAPIALAGAAVIALGAAFVLLYDDYKTWAEGGKSLFNWKEFDEFIKSVDFSVEGLAEAFWKLTTGYNSFSEAWAAGIDWLKSKGVIDFTAESIRNLWKAIREGFMSGEELSEFWRRTIEPIRLISEGKFREAAEVAGLTLRTDKGSVGGVFTNNLPRNDVSSSDVGLEAKLAAADAANGLPPGTMKAVLMQETGGLSEYIDNPSKYHYDLNSEGRRIAPHTGKVSTAFGPFGILESTGRDPGFGVSPLRDKTLDEQIRFAAEYLGARVRHAGSLEAGLAGYGEGSSYARSVMGRIDSGSAEARSFTRGATVGSGPSTGQTNNVEVHVGQVTVQTSATTLPAATAEGIAAGVKQSGDLLNQLAGGM